MRPTIQLFNPGSRTEPVLAAKRAALASERVPFRDLPHFTGEVAMQLVREGLTAAHLKSHFFPGASLITYRGTNLLRLSLPHT